MTSFNIPSLRAFYSCSERSRFTLKSFEIFKGISSSYDSVYRVILELTNKIHPGGNEYNGKRI